MGGVVQDGHYHSCVPAHKYAVINDWSPDGLGSACSHGMQVLTLNEDINADTGQLMRIMRRRRAVKNTGLFGAKKYTAESADDMKTDNREAQQAF